MKEFAIFWGCTIPTRFPFIEKSVRTVLDALKLPYTDIDGFTCCPEKSLVNNVDSGMWTLTAARNVAVADGEGVNVVSPCTGCISNLATVAKDLKTDTTKKKEVNKTLKEIGREFKGESTLKHLIPFLHDDFGVRPIKDKVKYSFKGMQVAIHYGCHMMRPGTALKADDPLNPKKFDTLVEALGAKSMQYMTKLTCCGQGLDRVDQHDKALTLARLKLRELKNLGADAMVLCCPSCYLQFDNNQFLMEKEGEKFGIPILYYTDMLGLAMGINPKDLGIDSHRMDAGPFLEKWAKLCQEEDALTSAERMKEGLNADSAFI
ncbi:MAG: hypothetical protein KAT46_01105 [Deltaproteobacteria bacterium]|nr:hypothetical protein [Deltaproteobacteria bacterium]